ncbi:hypothetical protein [Sporanaerobacter acetigenes]|uniref:Uncharacterized protein n=1 Tax=Sporanaerobacter acetigenes DSM 13106 TaxID=1123281 RepID=A0A1M5UP59_9FIRM|nr:hypothetical protein [Sporanaerobacter acetigenes]SHH64767.1 hypothetical protein SAMN02745180_00715 [Sporanaerobacter acetigenes DSM 13106]
MAEALLNDIVSALAELTDEVNNMENNMNYYQKNMTKKIQIIEKKIDTKNGKNLDNQVWINEYFTWMHMN